MMTIKLRHAWLCCMAGWLLCSLGWAKGITVSLDSDQIDLGQQVRLTLTYDPNAAQGTPNVAALQTDFAIVATEQAMSYTMMNGHAHSIAQWTLVLEPKHSGVLPIPVLRIGSLSTVPLQLKVRLPPHHAATRPAAASQAAPDWKHEIDFSAEVDQPKPYLNQQVIYKVSLITRQPLMNVRYQAPQVENAIILPLGQEHSYDMMRNGVAYQVEEQLYAIFPQKSGRLLIEPPALHALRYANTPQSVALTADPITLDVQSLPQGIARKQWLPTKLLRLREKYDQSATELGEGATIVRTIELQAQGLVAQLLPEIAVPQGSDLRAYRGQAKQDNRIEQGELWGRSRIKITYVFARPGQITLPAIRLPWFNLKTQQTEVAELPAKVYTIRPAAPSSQPQPKLPQKVLQRPAAANQALPNPPQRSWVFEPRMLAWLALVITVLGLATGLWIWQRHTLRPKLSLRNACLHDDVEATIIALVAWGQLQWPSESILHFTDLLPVLSQQDDLYTEVQSLVAVVYDPEHSRHWQGAGLWRAVQAYHQQQRHRRKQRSRPSVIPPI